MGKKQIDYLTPAVLIGAVAGLISSIPVFNCLCCLWIIVGAAISVRLLVTKSKHQIKTGDALLTGLLTGIVASLVNAVLEIPLRPVYFSILNRFIEAMSQFMEELPPGWENLTQMKYDGFNPFFFFMNLLLSSILFAFFGAIGGLIGYSLFGNKTTSGEDNVQTPSKDHGNSEPGL